MFSLVLENNNMDLIGFLENFWYRENSIYFTISCEEMYDKVNGLYQNTIPCVLQFSKDKEYKCFCKNVMKGQLIKVRGIFKENALFVTNYRLLETRENTFSRLKRMREKRQKEQSEKLGVKA